MGSHSALARGFAVLLAMAVVTLGVCEAFCTTGARQPHAEPAQTHCPTGPTEPDAGPSHAPYPEGTTPAGCGSMDHQLTGLVSVVPAASSTRPSPSHHFRPWNPVPAQRPIGPGAGLEGAVGPPAFPVFAVIVHHTTVLRI